MFLPVIPDRAYQMTVDAEIPKAIQDAEVKLVCNGESLGRLQHGKTTLTIPPQSADRVIIEIQTPTWVPRNVISRSQDDRELGIQVFSVSMKAEGAGDPVFNANTGE